MNKLSLMWRKLRYPLGRLAMNAATLLGLATGAAWLASIYDPARPYELIIQSVTLSVIAIVSMFALIVVGVKAAPGQQVFNALSDFDKASVRLRDFSSFVTKCLESDNSDFGRDIENARKLLTDALDDYAHAFSNIAGTRCRLCIKMFYEHEGEPYVYTLARDWSSLNEFSHDDEKRWENHHDKLEINTDFLMLYDQSVNDKGHFFSPDLESHEGYCSSSITYWQGGRHTKKWLLPYKSSIVWPIRQDKKPELGYAKDRLIGFLALDANIINAFSEERDVSMGRPLASLLYLVLQPFQDLMARRSLPTTTVGNEENGE